MYWWFLVCLSVVVDRLLVIVHPFRGVLVLLALSFCHMVTYYIFTLVFTV
jgi:hypothetical protein